MTSVQKLKTPISYTFLESSGRELSHGPILDIFFFEQISRNECFMKKIVFLHFFVSVPKKIQVAADRTIMKIDAFHIAPFEADVPNFSKHL